LERSHQVMIHEEEIRSGATTTLDEPISETIMRDVRQIAEKLQVVLLPLGKDNEDSVVKKLREWDLWGPLLVCLLLSSLLSFTAPGDSASLVFATVFVIVWLGAAVVTVNAQLLGGIISFFQSVCILGYCIFPLTLSALVSLTLKLIWRPFWLKAVIVLAGFVWSTRASVVFFKQVIKEERRVLAVYPVFFFYTFIAWMVLLQ